MKHTTTGKNDRNLLCYPRFCVSLQIAMGTERKIIHVDMDQFFAAVEQRDNPELRGKPIAVGWDAERGVVSTASYEARRFGVHSAQSIQVAKRLCQQLIIVPPHFEKYKEVSRQIHAIFHDYTDLIEPLSLDEAFLDVTENKKGIPLAVDIAREIKQRIKQETQLTASAGVSYCKFLAKIASDYRKPDGLCVIHPDKAQSFIDQLDVTRIWGVGKKTAEKMHRMGIFTGSDLRHQSQQHLVQVFGKMGCVFYDFARGIDNRQVVTEWERKSCGCERTYMTDLYDADQIAEELRHTAIELERRIAKAEFEGHTLTLKVKYADFQQITRSITVGHTLHTQEEMMPLVQQLLSEVSYSSAHAIRLLGLSVSNPGSSLQNEDGSFINGDSHQSRWIQLELPFKEWDEQ